MEISTERRLNSLQRGAGRAPHLYALCGLWVPSEPKEGLAAGHGFTSGSALSIREKKEHRRCRCALLSLIQLLQVGCVPSAAQTSWFSCTNLPGTQGLLGEAESISAAFPSCNAGMARAALLCAHLCQHVAVPIVLPS